MSSVPARGWVHQWPIFSPTPSLSLAVPFLVPALAVPRPSLEQCQTGTAAQELPVPRAK